MAGFPAHAGMDPCSCRSPPRPRGLPRTRGDGPSSSRRAWYPPGLPRTRGDGPQIEARAVLGGDGFPRTARGWTVPVGTRADRSTGFPAHAGMDPAARDGPGRRARLPRTRGDGPLPTRIAAPGSVASPHTRGWTQRLDAHGDIRAGFPAHAGWTRDAIQVKEAPRGFPAHAGMDPLDGGRARRARGLPRTRGDGPPPGRAAEPSRAASPHTRGWTPPVGRC